MTSATMKNVDHRSLTAPLTLISATPWAYSTTGPPHGHPDEPLARDLERRIGQP